MKENTDFYKAVIQTIKSVPRGRVASYGQIARLAGKPRGSRQVAWFLHSSSKKHRLPWHRIINSQGKVSLPDPLRTTQLRLLKKEGVQWSPAGVISFKEFGLENF